jgi:transcriptional regulator with XRE-family HTH domain
MIKHGRELAGIDQRQLAMLAEVSPRTIVAVESSLPQTVDPRRRAVLERIRNVLEREFRIAFDPASGRVWRRRLRRVARAKRQGWAKES